MNGRSRPDAPIRTIGTWLYVCCAMVLAMILLGGITRLTESGLSIVDWRPVTGWLPPLNEAEWRALFDAYRETPEFRKLNFWMALADFKTIFWLEYLHRLWGRVIGLVFLLPFLWFAIRYRMPGWLGRRLVLFFALGGAQGVLGWYMVKSGLVDAPAVSQYRLAAHLALAVLIYGLMFHTALGLRMAAAGAAPARPGLAPVAAVMAGLVFLTMVWGAFLAGIDGGAVYNTFPLMDGHVVPPGLFAMEPWTRNFFENVAAVQFAHRVLAVVTAATAIAVWAGCRRAALPAPLGTALALTALAAAAQFALGVATLLSGAALALAWAHQAGALALFTGALWAWRAAAGPTRPA